MLVIDNVTVRIAGRVILNGATATLPAGRRIGLVGRNGAGKSTLLKVIQGFLHPDDGETSIPKDWRLGALAQEAPSGPMSLIDTVLAADKERADLLTRAETEKDPHAIADIHARLHTIDAYSAPARAAEILAGLGFGPEEQLRPCSEFSGGWRMRVALAAVLFSAPDLLLLDEPTNYLDLEGVLWLEDFLKRYRGTVLIVSHDRDLLNSAAEFILHLEAGKLTLYTGGYDTFQETRAMKRALDEATAKKVDAQRAHLQSFVDRFRAKASKATQAQSRLKMLERLQKIDLPVDEHVAPIRLPAATEASPPLVVLDNAAVGYDGRQILGGINLRFDPEDRIALLGKNGNGKSTLAKLLAGRLQPMRGEVISAKKLVPGYFAQHQLEELDGNLTPVETLAELRRQWTPQQVRTQLGSFGFSADKALTKVASLSGGERARLMLALVTLDSPNLLILDEPTNHLDIDARNELLKALNDFNGAVVLVSHDRRLLEATADRLLLVADGKVTPFEGDLDDYRKFLLTPDAPVKEAQTEEAPKLTKEEARKEAAERRRRFKPLKDKVDAAEHQIADLTKEIAKLDKALADPLLFVQDPKKGQAVSKQRADAARKLEAAEERWLVLSEEYQEAMGE
ncbi:ATP-binding cassette subfamily F protein 3 [Rhizomicrobium palustre]|uniref:ATP-binding cassette subfamily F protein 3 n=1 Tax=Rhizomicrobium palustre TaxID=189966 RepID=A0A846MUX5_9PROT|nr:ABC-F family ATP-binding cassette domain-containing protein [Rhizomicrobium palustre]NIK86991.1 ATP-binding cassette subfamily F protein 3 [Rhizomicrobium palustre]